MKDNSKLTLQCCPWQWVERQHQDYIAHEGSGKPVTVVSHTFGTCCQSECPFWDTNTDRCTRTGK